MESTRKVQQPASLVPNDGNSPQTDSNPLTPKLRAGAKAKYIIEEHPILDGTGKVVRTRHTGDTYHCFFYIKDERKWVRKSLHTKHLGEALDAGRKLMYQTFARIDIGEKIFAKSIGNVVAEFIKEKQQEADAKMITQGRVSTIRTTLNWAIDYVGGENKPINSMDGAEWKRYYVWRRTIKPEVKDVTLVNERSMIASLFHFADEKQYISKRNFPQFDKSLSKHKQVDRRDAFTDKEYLHVCSILRYFDKHGKNDYDKDNRKFIRDFYMLSCNNGLRFGEMRRLTWQQVQILNEKDADNQPLCEIKLNATDTKNRKARIVQGMRGDIFARIKEYSKYTKPTDFVFADNRNGEQLPKMVYYKLWAEMMEKAKLQNRDMLTWYSCRHTYATFRLLHSKDLDVFTLAKNMGTSVKFIEDHYGHLETVQKRPELVSKKSRN